MYKCSICLACAGSGPHYQPHNTWLVVYSYTITATHTIQFDDLNLHVCFSLTFTSCYLSKIHVSENANKGRPGRPTTTHSPKHCINVSYLADFICLSDRFLNNRCMLDQTCFLGPLLGTMGAKNLYPCGLLLWISVRLWRQDKACVLHACYYNHYKISAIQDTMKTS